MSLLDFKNVTTNPFQDVPLDPALSDRELQDAFNSRIITLLVGPEETEIQVWEHAIRKIPYFKARLSERDDLEAKSGVLHFPNLGFPAVSRLMIWLIQGFSYTALTQGNFHHPVHPNEVEALFDLADSWAVPAFSLAICRLIFEVMIRDAQAQEADLDESNHIDYAVIYYQSLKKSRFRYIAIDFMAEALPAIAGLKADPVDWLFQGDAHMWTEVFRWRGLCTVLESQPDGGTSDDSHQKLRWKRLATVLACTEVLKDNTLGESPLEKKILRGILELS